MKAFLIYGKLDGSLKEVPENRLAADEVKIRVSYVGICGSDLHYYFDGANGAFVVEEPLIPGHELSGVIVEDPSGEFKPGTNVTLHPATHGVTEKGIEDKPYLWPKGAYLGSASTHPHTQGAMAEYFVAKKSMVRVLPESLSLELATLAEPLGVAIHAINVADGVRGKKILVSGSGPIGLCVVAAAKILGATSITATDILSSALKRAEALGATTLLQIGKDQLPENVIDVVFECSAAPVALSSAFNSVRRAGVVVQVGMLGAGPQPIAIAPLISKEIQLRGSFRFNDEITDAVTMLVENEWIKSIITHVIPLSDAVSAFNIAKDSEKSGKVLVKIN
jgi:L-idonate 5-dehydrogenase